MTRSLSVLFVDPTTEAPSATPQRPGVLSDLHLDQIIDSITSGRDEYDLMPYLCTPLRRLDDIRYRHEVFRDLSDRTLLEVMRSFGQSMARMRDRLAQADKLQHRYQQHSLFLEAVGIYADTLRCLGESLAKADISSRALLAFREDLSNYLRSPELTALITERREVIDGLSRVSYCINIKGLRVTVRKYEDETDYSQEVQGVFERFRQGESRDHRVQIANRLEMNQVETNILELVARLYNDEFTALDDYCISHRSYVDARVRQFDREIQLYLAYLEFIQPLISAGLPFCYPDVTRESKEVLAADTFDLALANKLVTSGSRVVCNELHLTGPERVLVVSGPNQGGKTTLARTFGQLHHLAAVGLLVPGTEARLFLFDALFTHFPREEDLAHSTGKLEDDLIRIREILIEATKDSIIVINELFSSTTLKDSILLGTKVMGQIASLDLLAVYVTFVDELSTLSDATVSMVSTVVRGNRRERTYKVVRMPADGLAYAIALAEQYGLTYDLLIERLNA